MSRLSDNPLGHLPIRQLSRPKVNMAKPIYVTDGQVLRYKYDKNSNPKSVTIFSICCDCDLTHVERIKFMPTHVVWQVWRDDDITKVRRQETRKKLLRMVGKSKWQVRVRHRSQSQVTEFV